MAITIAYDKEVKGWTSEYSYILDSAVSLNNNFYTFKNGRIWVHNSASVNRNTFYGLFSPTEIVFIFNDQPSSVKNFKTIAYEGLGAWESTIETNLEKGQIAVENFTNKEGRNFAFIRGESNNFNPDLKSSNVGGIGVVDTITGLDEYNFTSVTSSVAINDLAYIVESNVGAFDGEPKLAGRITATTGTSITIEQTVDLGTMIVQAPVTGDLVFYVKDNTVEKSGLIGFYSIVTLTSNDATEAELFSIGSEAFISTK